MAPPGIKVYQSEDGMNPVDIFRESQRVKEGRREMDEGNGVFLFLLLVLLSPSCLLQALTVPRENYQNSRYPSTI